MSGVILGIEVAIIHLLQFKYFNSRNIKLLLASLILMVIACIQGKRGIALVIVSATTVALIQLAKFLVSKFEKSKTVIFIKENLSFAIISVVAVLLLLFSVRQNLVLGDSFERDVVRSYFGNIYGTSRFSAVPVIEICLAHFIYAVSGLYILFFRKKNNNLELFVSVMMTTLIYLIMIGYCYVYKWAAGNLAEFGEYMTGFGDYMIVITSLGYSFLAYNIAMIIIRKYSVGR